MLGELSIMDWVTLVTIIANVGVILGVIVQLYRDNKALNRELEGLSKEHNGLSKEHNGLSKEHDDLSKEHSLLSKESTSLLIREDTKYVADEMKLEKMARQELYKNSNRAKEILETMDMMKEVVLQNAQLNAEVSMLKQQNHELLLNQKQEDTKLLQAIKSFENRLASLESYGEAEEIKSILKRIEKQLSEYSN